jgi:hypothetical protein
MCKPREGLRPSRATFFGRAARITGLCPPKGLPLISQIGTMGFGPQARRWSLVFPEMPTSNSPSPLILSPTQESHGA